MLSLTPSEFPVDRVIADFYGTSMSPRLPLDEIQGLHDSGLSTDEDGDTITDVEDPDLPFGWSVIEADDMSLFLPGEVL